MTRRARFFAACASLIVLAPPAAARPSLWDVARDPASGHADAALAAALKARFPRDIPSRVQHLFEGLLSLRAATLIELAGGERLPNAELHLFLGEALVHGGGDREADGRRILLEQLAREPNAAHAARAWFSVAIASNRLLDFETEKRAYDAALSLEWDPDQRARILMNRGETKMALGMLSAARADYERALSSSNDSEVFALANWGLAVALARDSELPMALERAGAAAALKFEVDGREVTALDLPSVFYTPEYEIHFYRALGEMAQARTTRAPEAAFRSLRSARSLLELYLSGARPAEDRWVESAERYLAWCERKIGERTSEKARAAPRRR